MIPALLVKGSGGNTFAQIIVWSAGTYLLLVLPADVSMFQRVNIIGASPPSNITVINSSESAPIAKLERRFSRSFSRVSQDLDHLQVTQAAKAISDALILLRRIKYTNEPWVGVNDEGFSVAHWRNGKKGVLLIFSGNNSVTISMSRAERSYADIDRTYEISNATARIVSFAIRNTYV